MKKFVHLLFQTTNDYYMYDANINDIVNLSEGAYNYLSIVRKGENVGIASDDIISELDDLKKQGYLAPFHVEEIKHPLTEDLHLYLSRTVASVCLQLTKFCNLKCVYCPYTENVGSNRTHSNEHMSLDVATKALNLLLNHSADATSIKIQFYGGEPLLELELLKQIVDYGKRIFRGKSLSFHVTTNATLLKGDLVKYLSENDISAMVSLDGTKSANDENRVYVSDTGSVYDSVITNLKYVRHSFPEYYKTLSINATIDPKYDFEEFVKFLEEDPISQLVVNAKPIDDVDLTAKNVYSESYLSKTRYYQYLALLQMIGRYPSDASFPYVRNTIVEYTKAIYALSSKTIEQKELRKKNSPAGICLPGVQRLFISSDGNLYPCEKVSETANSMIIGNVYDGFDIIKVAKMLNLAQLTISECMSCWAFKFCNLCAKFSVDDAGELSSAGRAAQCSTTRWQVFEYLRFVALQKEINIYNNRRIAYDQSSGDISC